MPISKLCAAAWLCTAALTAFLAFACPAACAAAAHEALLLCGGPLLYGVFPFLIVSALVAASGMAGLLGLPLRPVTRLLGIRAKSAAAVLLMGLVGGFAPAAAMAGALHRCGELGRNDTEWSLAAACGSGPSFVVLAVGGQLLGSTAVGVRLLLCQVLAAWGAVFLLRLCAQLHLPGGAVHTLPGPSHGDGCNDSSTEATAQHGALPANSSNPTAPADRAARISHEVAPPSLYRMIADAALTFIKLCGFVVYFRFLSGGLTAVLPPCVCLIPTLLFEVTSACAAAAATPGKGAVLCCAALSLQGLSVLMQVRAICPREVSLGPLLAARPLHLVLSLALFRFLPAFGGSAEVFNSLADPVIPLRRSTPGGAALLFVLCVLLAGQLCRTLHAKEDNV